ncbi:MAG: NCS2 family permease [Firmicutes bacterium]|nr:NCS2 family permease [Bacillota bacterium]
MERWFHLSEFNSNIRTEVIAGLTTFVAMAYILFVNPSILGATGMDRNAVFFATAVGAGVVTMAMGLFVNFPIALAPGMGLNAYFMTVVLGSNGAITWQVGLGAVFISGIIFIILTVTRVRQLLVVAVPTAIQYAITVGIGLFITVIGLKLGNFMSISLTIPHAVGIVPNLDWNLGIGNVVHDRVMLLGIVGLFLDALLMVLRIPAALLIGILVTTLIGIPLGVSNTAALQHPQFLPNLSHLAVGKLDIRGAIDSGIIEMIATFTFVELFDTFGTLVGTAQRAGLLERPDGQRRLGRAMLVDASGVSFGALMGTSTITAFVESATGIAAGGRTGLTAVTTGVVFLLALLLAPLAGIIPDAATAPALILVGVLMMQSVRLIDWSELRNAIPAFLTIVMMPFTYSIANGVSFGIVSYCIINGVRNLVLRARGEKVEQIHWLMWVLFLLVIARFIFIEI